MSTFKAKMPLSFLRVLSPSELFRPSNDRVLTPLLDAIQELKSRQEITGLREKVEAYLHNDVPSHFKDGPILYLARHLATPNFETLRFLHLVEPSGIAPVIGQDLKDKFVPNNQLKKALGKPSISHGITSKDGKFHEQFSNVSVINFNTANGKPLQDITTHWGEPLADFHARLFKETCKQPITLVDDSEWIDRNHRGDLLEHYKRFLALFLVHGILFEDLEFEDKQERKFMNKVLIPAFHFIERKFGYKPLIVQLTPTSVESARFWLSYPREMKDKIGAPIQRRSDNS